MNVPPATALYVAQQAAIYHAELVARCVLQSHAVVLRNMHGPLPPYYPMRCWTDIATGIAWTSISLGGCATGILPCRDVTP